MNKETQRYVAPIVGGCRTIRSRFRTPSLYLAAVAGIFICGQTAYSQPDQPDRTIYADVPFEMVAPWFRNPKTRTDLVDEVVMQGTLKITMRIWQTSPDKIDRFALHANAVDIKGTSETTGQRYRINGSFSYDLIDPEVTFNPDGTFTVPDQPFQLRMHMVDPAPAQLTATVSGSSGAIAASIYHPPPAPVPCERVYAADGTPTTALDCGTAIFSYYILPLPYIYRVLSSGGDACVPGQICIVPDGATLFNGYTGGYTTPLFLQMKANMATYYGSSPGAKSARVYCQTGDGAPLVSSAFLFSTLFQGSCRPIYSSTEPIKVWAETTYQFYRWVSGENRTELATLVISEPPFTFYMDERPMDQAPVISTFSVSAASRINGRCEIGQVCELEDGDVIYNTQVGDFERDLFLSVTANDPEGDPIFVEWFCKSGSYLAPITNQLGGVARCTAGYIYPGAIEVYARVSDGNNSVWSERRILYMLEFIH